MTPIHEDYLNYRPPAWVIKTVRRLLESLPDRQLDGLSAIVVTESARVRKGRTLRLAGKKYAMKDCFGFYRPRWRGEPPAIFLIIDNILDAKPPEQVWMPFEREFRVGGVLFHEVGHHLNHTRRSVAAGEEASAEEWQRRLGRIYFSTKYWYLCLPIVKALRPILGWLWHRSQQRVPPRSPKLAN